MIVQCLVVARGVLSLRYEINTHPSASGRDPPSPSLTHPHFHTYHMLCRWQGMRMATRRSSMSSPAGQTGTSPPHLTCPLVLSHNSPLGNSNSDNSNTPRSNIHRSNITSPCSTLVDRCLLVMQPLLLCMCIHNLLDLSTFMYNRNHPDKRPDSNTDNLPDSNMDNLPDSKIISRCLL